MPFLSAGAPPSSIRAYVEDMLNELAELADRVEEARLATAIRGASVIAAESNAREWLALQRRSETAPNRR